MGTHSAAGFRELPDAGSWVHLSVRTGFEVAFFQRMPDGHVVEGTTAAVETDAWTVTYAIIVDSDWTARKALVTSRTRFGLSMTEIHREVDASWWVNGTRRPDLDGCLDIDLESSAVTNTFPVHRMALAVGESSEAPAVYVRAMDASVERLEQHYRRLPGAQDRQRFRYDAAAFDFSEELTFDASGLILDYPGIAHRHNADGG
jgi:hypothetical protein